MSSRYKSLKIQTPEGICFSLEIASPIVRFMAWLLDKACVVVATNLFSMLIRVIGSVSDDLASALMIAVYFVLSLFYPILLEWYWGGQTVGKRLLKIQVMDVEGLRITFSQIVLRNLLRAVDALPQLYLVGGLAAFFNSRGQRLGDLAANTMVVQHVDIVEPDFDQALAGKYNSFRDYPHIVARLRQNISPEEAGIALQALIRRDSLDDSARLNLFAEIRKRLEQPARFPAEALEGISDEQFVRNAVDILFS